MEAKSTLYIHNLSDGIGMDKLRSNLFLLFSMYGEVIDIRLDGRQLRGQAFIRMSTPDEANLARITLNGEPFFGQPLKIEFSKNEMTV
ncbi:hypothetical protein Kpol_322p1 [Vanderwaltozyma polyspora DSM 70294]|uniref:RRM domain-containing protein n=1 Tax=Vanderwaltozyma polyspora (strain ATCC 22028 / DSM 70294 / BCRC 21397 / CBS 2163 / NBRC 10782 / NRRL Y-8283 / UCD 57-17) TaxID=436907 RepID=A7TSX5_VANPO|nr:uncharacterized protein Kpol_322p1 [Vanderwaltozyma polyspora DSM 70294]EDO14624.1 hypothetical protein Kpol_322p1 [Vanderwaltozyma polyspora DSM 70294]